MRGWAVVGVEGTGGSGGRRFLCARAGCQSRKSSGNDWSNTKSGTGTPPSVGLTPPLVGLSLGRIERWRLIQKEVALRRAASGGDRRRFVVQFEVEEDRGDDGRIGEEGENLHLAPAGGAEQGQHFATHATRGCPASEQHGPADASGIGEASRVPHLWWAQHRWRAAALSRGWLGSGAGRRVSGLGACR